MQGNDFLPVSNCGSKSCSKDQVLSPSCICSHPYTGTLHFFSFSFSDFQNLTYYNILRGSITSVLLSDGLAIEPVFLGSPAVDIYSYLQIPLQIFPSEQDIFNRKSVSRIGFLLNRQPFSIEYFGPFYFIDQPYCCFPGNLQLQETYRI